MHKLNSNRNISTNFFAAAAMLFAFYKYYLNKRSIFFKDLIIPWNRALLLK
jgi:hypothetical protein